MLVSGTAIDVRHSMITEVVTNMSEINWITKVKQQLVKENMQGDFSLSHLEPTFYKRLNEFRMKATKEDLDIIDSIVNRIIRIRIGKLLRLIDIEDTKEIHNFLADEEHEFWEFVQHSQKNFKEKVLLNVS